MVVAKVGETIPQAKARTYQEQLAAPVKQWSRIQKMNHRTTTTEHACRQLALLTV